MPYKIIRKGNKWLTVNKQTGKVKGTHSSKHKAIAQMRLLYGVEGGKFKPTGAKGKPFKVRKKRWMTSSTGKVKV